MKNKMLLILLLICLFSCPSVIMAKDVKDGVICSYNLKTPIYENHLTKFDIKAINYTDNTHEITCNYGDGKGYGKCNNRVADHTIHIDVVNDDYNIIFRFEDEFYKQYYNSGGICPDIYTLLDINYKTYELQLVKNANYDFYTITKADNKELIQGDQTATPVDPATPEDTIKDILKCEYNFGSDIGKATQRYHYNLDAIFIKKQNVTKNTYIYNLILKNHDNNKEVSYSNIEKNKTWPNTFPGPDSVSGNKLNIEISEKTFKDVVDGTTCIDKKDIGSYFDEVAGAWTLKITTDKDEIQDLIDDGETVYDGDSTVSNDPLPTIPPLDPPDLAELSCSSLFGDPGTSGTPAYYLTYAFKIARYIAIVLLVVLSIMDFIESTASQDKDSINKAINKTIKRLVLCVIIFLLPSLIEFILTILNDRAANICINY